MEAKTMRPISVFVPLIAAALVAAASNATPDERSENEKAAIVAVKTIQVAQTQYFSQFGHYAASLRQLGDPDRGGKITPEAAGLLEPELAKGHKNGYRFALDSRGAAVYSISAAPTHFGTTGSRTYGPIRPVSFTNMKGLSGLRPMILRCAREPHGLTYGPASKVAGDRRPFW
jgi:type IV pilus assembly protein PilA